MIERAPGIAGMQGQPLADAEIATSIHPWKKAVPERGNAQLRGLGPQGFLLRPELHLLRGRLPRPGAREILAGTMAVQKFVGLEVGKQIVLANAGWRVTGVFETGDTLDGDLVTDFGALRAVLGRDSYNSVLLRLGSPDTLDILQRALRNQPLTVMRQTDYYRRLWKAVPNFPLVVAYGLGFLLAMGAISGTLYTMDVAVGMRAQEIAVLRAVGFGAAAVAASVVAEAMLLACLGAVIGTAINWLWLEGYAYNGGIEGGVFRVAVTPALLAVAICWALAIAAAGAALPALRAARGTVAEALRDL